MIPLAVDTVRAVALQIEIIAKACVLVIEKLQIFSVDVERHVKSLAKFILEDERRECECGRGRGLRIRAWLRFGRCDDCGYSLQGWSIS